MLPTETVTRRLSSARPTEGARARGGEPTRAVLDTNTVLDWLVFGDEAARALGAAVVAGRIRWLTTPRMLAELRSVLTRPLHPRWETARELALTIDLANLAVICPEPAAGHQLICRDAADQVFVDLALELSPALLLTRDRALLALRRRAATRGVVIATAVSWQHLGRARG